MAISTRDLMKELLPGLNALFKEEYETINLTFKPYIKMPRRGRYQIWKGGEMLADKIRHRREALAMTKLLMENDDGNG